MFHTFGCERSIQYISQHQKEEEKQHRQLLLKRKNKTHPDVFWATAATTPSPNPSNSAVTLKPIIGCCIICIMSWNDTREGRTGPSEGDTKGTIGTVETWRAQVASSTYGIDFYLFLSWADKGHRAWTSLGRCKPQRLFIVTVTITWHISTVFSWLSTDMIFQVTMYSSN